MGVRATGVEVSSPHTVRGPAYSRALSPGFVPPRSLRLFLSLFPRGRVLVMLPTTSLPTTPLPTLPALPALPTSPPPPPVAESMRCFCVGERTSCRRRDHAALPADHTPAATLPLIRALRGFAEAERAGGRALFVSKADFADNRMPRKLLRFLGEPADPDWIERVRAVNSAIEADAPSTRRLAQRPRKAPTASPLQVCSRFSQAGATRGGGAAQLGKLGAPLEHDDWWCPAARCRGGSASPAWNAAATHGQGASWPCVACAAAPAEWAEVHLD